MVASKTCTCFWFWTSLWRLKWSHLVDKKQGDCQEQLTQAILAHCWTLMSDNRHLPRQLPYLECWVLLGCSTWLRSILTCFIRSSHVLGLMATPWLRPNISDALVICQWPSISYSRYSYDIPVSNFVYISSCATLFSLLWRLSIPKLTEGHIHEPKLHTKHVNMTLCMVDGSMAFLSTRCAVSAGGLFLIKCC